MVSEFLKKDLANNKELSSCNTKCILNIKLLYICGVIFSNSSSIAGILKLLSILMQHGDEWVKFITSHNVLFKKNLD